ncbi:MAG: serine hydrolase [Terracidiphilus sp.]
MDLSASGARGFESTYGPSARARGRAQLRPTGSIFKPFVYAAAFNTAIEGTILPGQTTPFSPVTMLSDEPTTYEVGDQEYTPRNDHGLYHEEVTARYALQQSLNNATIGLAALVGFDRVASLARDAGVKNARGTPSVAIGSYGATPFSPTTVSTLSRGLWPVFGPRPAISSATTHLSRSSCSIRGWRTSPPT